MTDRKALATTLLGNQLDIGAGEEYGYYRVNLSKRLHIELLLFRS